ncbi:SDR family NAD(P)-dependent oxidoreductase [Streptomyces sp. NPDC028635]|uniref:SDR family NAD(P)-dependent oxidoreductase n=1 Tax=Streptomyces sp. NPDC028635 TaxID=3154800 RepID=UPI0033D2C378
MDAKEILTRVQTGALDAASAAALLRARPAGTPPQSGRVPLAEAEALLRAAVSGAGPDTGVRAASAVPAPPAGQDPARRVRGGEPSGTAVPRAQAEALLRAAAAQAPQRRAETAPAEARTDRGRRTGAEQAGAQPAGGPGVPEPVAVIGYSARFPGAPDADGFWQRLLDGDDLVTEVPAERWRIDDHYDPRPEAEGKSVSKWGAYVDGVDRFDAEFFRITPREAELMDPQARLFLQEAWRALEHAGQRTSALAGTRCGVYAGVMMNDYQDLIERVSEHARLAQVMQGNSNSLLAARIAYHLDLKGPAVTVDTACSSSLVALHQACQALWLGEADMMLVGGVTLYLTELPHVFMSRAGMLSPTGRCRPFDAAADGIVPGEGCAVVVVKPLSRALADGDPVHAVIRAAGIGQDGRTNGITAPSGASQARLVAQTLDRFGLDASGIDYVECHGTGTPLGDPIEVTALNEVFAPAGLPPASVPIGSVKGNVGHTSAAAGLAGLLKAIGVVRTGQVPPSLHCTALNPRIPFDEGPFTVATERRTLPSGDRPRRASVSSFGFSGTNAYVVVEQTPPEAAPTEAGPGRVSPSGAVRRVAVALSGRRPGSVPAYAAELGRWLRSPAGADVALTDLAHTLACARDHHRHRTVLLVADRAELLLSLDLLVSGAPDERRVTATPGSGHRPVDTARLGPLLERAAAGEPAALREVAEAHADGHRVDWARVCPPTRHRRISAPGYAFAADRHWVAPVPADDDADDRHWVASAPADDDADDRLAELVLHTPDWEDCPLPDRVLEPGTALYVHDGPGDLAAALGGTAPEDAATAAQPPAAALVLRLTGAVDADVAAVDAVRQVLAAHRTQPLTVLAVTADPLRADAARALVQTLRQENPRLSGRALLVTDDGAPAAAQVRRELAAPEAEFGHLADMRGQRRTRRVLRPAPMPGTRFTPRPDGVYLVTGGMGGIGRALVRHLRETPGVRVVVCGRTPWEDLDPAVRPPADGSGRVRYVRADVAAPGGAAGLIGDILGHEGALHGVFHAAGVVKDAYLLRKSAADVASVLAPKALGATALDDATARLPLDVFVLFSSVAAVTGNLGQADYAYANGLLDGLAHRRAALIAAGERHGRTLSVQWPLWDVPGMTIPEPVRQVVEERVGMRPLPAGLGIGALERLLGGDTEVVSLFHGRAGAWRHHLGELELLPAAATDDAPAASTDDPPATARRPEPAGARTPEPAGAQAPVQEPARADAPDALLDLVCRTVAATLGHDPATIGPGTSLEALGLDSVMMRTLAARLSSRIAPVGPEMLFGLRDLTELTDHLKRLLPEQHVPAPTPAPGAAEAGPRVTEAAGAEARVVEPAVTGERGVEPAGADERGVEPAGVGPGAVAGERAVAVGRSSTPADDEVFAIVGISGRYPGADTLDAFWENLLVGKDTVGDLPAHRWHDTGGVRARGHFLDDVDAFDPVFFGMSAHEAAYIDPQERLFLEVAWEALEDAGLTGVRLDALTARDGVPRSVGVFAGITSADYALLGAERWAAGHRDTPSGHHWSPPNRLSYLLDLRGPSQAVDTACSSSLVALHLAVESLRAGECAAALVGGVNLYLHPSRFRMLRRSGFLAEDGRCRSFGTSGTGFGPGEGAGALVVKPFSRALADGDTVHALIRGTAVSHGGRTNGFTAPSPRAQARVLRAALERAGVDAATVNVVEAHGTGTELGDPVEVAALKEVYGEGAAAAVPCSLGSVKSAIGHGESAAGIAALTKVVLQLRHATLAPTLHADPVNPGLGIEGSRFTLQHEAGAWPRLRDADGRPQPRRAGVSSFGAGGVNAHAIVEEHLTGTAPATATATAPATATATVTATATETVTGAAAGTAAATAAGTATPAGTALAPAPVTDTPGGVAAQAPQLVLVSAPTRDHLRALAGRLAEWLAGPGRTTPLADLARTLRTGRAVFPGRLAVVAASTGELAAELERFARDGQDSAALRTGTADTSRDASQSEELVAALWRAGRLEELADLWAAGRRFDRIARDEAAGGVVPLPPTPLCRTRHWLPDPDPVAAVPASPPAQPAATPSVPANEPVTRPALPDDERIGRLVDFIGELAAGDGAAGAVDTGRTLVELGVDSIGAMNLRFEIAERFGQTLPLQQLSESTVDELVAHLSAL